MINQHSRLSSILTIISLFSMEGNSFICICICKTLQVFVGLVQWQAVGCFQTGRSRCFEGWGWGPWWFAAMADQVGPPWSCLKIIVAILFNLYPFLIGQRLVVLVLLATCVGEHRRQGTSHAAGLLW
jgi:hypothetical protein